MTEKIQHPAISEVSVILENGEHVMVIKTKIALDCLAHDFDQQERDDLEKYLMDWVQSSSWPGKIRYHRS